MRSVVFCFRCRQVGACLSAIFTVSFSTVFFVVHVGVKVNSENMGRSSILFLLFYSPILDLLSKVNDKCCSWMRPFCCLCQHLTFRPFDVAIFGRFACRCRNFVQSHVFHTPRPHTPYPGTPALHFPPGLAEAAMILPAALHKCLMRKRTFVTLFGLS